MFRFLALLLALFAVAYAEVSEVSEFSEASEVSEVSEVDELGNRIVGGSNTAITAVPWQVSLRFNNNHFCGGSLISTTWVVSAAHCTIGLNTASITVLAGTNNRFSGGQVRQANWVINHPNYNSRNDDNDISLVRVNSAFTLSNAIRTVALPNQGAGVSNGAYGIVSGWGRLTEGGSLPTTLQSVWVPVVAQATCNAAYWGGITNNMLCAGYLAGGRDACQGDSGGPYVINGQLIGVVSWGAGCARRNFPGVYARVPVYRNWIRTNTGV